MNKPSESTFRIGASRPTMQTASFQCRTANLMLYRLYTTRCIACIRMRPAEAAYRNAQYKFFGIKARWVRKNRTVLAGSVPTEVHGNLRLRPLGGLKAILIYLHCSDLRFQS